MRVFPCHAQASVAILDRKMAALKADIAQQAALAAQRHKFNQGSEHPSGDASPSRLASGLAATAQVALLQRCSTSTTVSSVGMSEILLAGCDGALSPPDAPVRFGAMRAPKCLSSHWEG